MEHRSFQWRIEFLGHQPQIKSVGQMSPLRKIPGSILSTKDTRRRRFGRNLCFISDNGTGVCHMYTGRINQITYRDTSDNALLPSGKLMYSPEPALIFQQDWASAHTAKSIKEWFNEKGITTIPWPSRSSDLNPIKNIWSWIDSNMVKSHISLPEQLKEELQKISLKIPLELCQSLIESVP